MDVAIAGIMIVVVTAVLVALVRATAQKPKQPVRRRDSPDILDAKILGDQIDHTWTDLGGSGSDGDFGH